jgi:hypothetical protein
MKEHLSNQQLYEQLMDINGEAFGRGLYEVAYHVLAAALHAALSVESEAFLASIEQRAREQRDWIDTYAADPPLSSPSASSHGHASAYTSLVKQIQTRLRMQRHVPPPL